MENFRSICICYDYKDSFLKTYIEEFFRWIGFMNFSVSENQMVPNTEKDNFDLFVCINRRREIPKLHERRTVVLETEDTSEEEVLNNLLKWIKDNPNIIPAEKKEAYEDTIIELAKIYEEQFLVNILNDYSFTLFQYMKGMGVVNNLNEMRERIKKGLEDVKELIAKRRSDQPTSTLPYFMEYLLFVKWNMVTYIGRVDSYMKRILKVEPEEFKKGSDEIYEYDSGMIMLELLKARNCAQDKTYSGIERIHYESILDNCPIGAYKSMCYYYFGKWEAINNAPFDAYESYKNGYFCYEDNIWTLFKIIIHKLAIRENETAKYFIEKALNIFPSSSQARYMPLIDREFVYKLNLLSIEVYENKRFDVETERFANNYVKSLEDDSEYTDSFLSKMYPKDNTYSKIRMEDISFAMLKRLVYEVTKRHVEEHDYWNR